MTSEFERGFRQGLEAGRAEVKESLSFPRRYDCFYFNRSQQPDELAQWECCHGKRYCTPCERDNRHDWANVAPKRVPNWAQVRK